MREAANQANFNAGTRAQPTPKRLTQTPKQATDDTAWRWGSYALKGHMQCTTVSRSLGTFREVHAVSGTSRVDNATS